MYRMMMKPANKLITANPGVAKGDPRKLDMVDQSRAKEPMPSPLRPEPICWAVMESFHIQQTKERAVID